MLLLACEELSKAQTQLNCHTHNILWSSDCLPQLCAHAGSHVEQQDCLDCCHDEHRLQGIMACRTDTVVQALRSGHGRRSGNFTPEQAWYILAFRQQLAAAESLELRNLCTRVPPV